MVTATLPAKRQRYDPDEPMPCFETKRDWQLYLEGRSPAGPCYDCSPTYQADMIAQGRCQHPEVVFLTVKGRTIGLKSHEQLGGASRQTYRGQQTAD